MKAPELLKLIQQRRSIGKYDLNRLVADSDVLKCIEAALYAPSGCNAQPWRFYWIKGEEMRRRIKEKDILFYQPEFYDAPVWIIVASCPDEYIDKRGAKHQIGENLPLSLEERNKPFEKENIDTSQNRRVRAARDTAFGVSYLLLMAASLGLDASPVGLIKKDAIIKEIRIPESEQIEFAIVMGYKPADYQIKAKEVHSIDEVLRVY